MSDKTKIFSMADLTNADPLTLTERKELIKGCMTVLLDEDDRLSNLGMLLSKYEETIRAVEKQLAEAQRDAARYRWLCENNNIILGAEIDAAMEQTTK